MTNEEAWLYAASWGSYMTSGDPGACMYGFDSSFQVQSECHRTACINWIDNHCVPLVKAHPDWPEYEPDELERLVELRAKIEKAKVAA